MRPLRSTASQPFSSGARLTPAPVGRVTPCAPSWRTQTPPLTVIALVNQGTPVGRRRRAQDCPPYLRGCAASSQRVPATPPSPHHPARPNTTANPPTNLDCGGKRSATPLSPAPATPRTLLRHWMLGVVAVRKDCWLLDISPILIPSSTLHPRLRPRRNQTRGTLKPWVFPRIKPNQTSLKNDPAICASANGAASYQPRATLWVRSPEGAAHPCHSRPQSRQKPLQSCLIKANQGKRQIGESSRWMGRTGSRMPDRVPGKNPLLGERKQVRESVPLTCLTASLCRPPTIKANRASSRQIKANDEKAKRHHNERQRRGPIPAQGNALGLHPMCLQALKGRPNPPIKAEKPRNRA